jgi:hypothetical protein
MPRMTNQWAGCALLLALGSCDAPPPEEARTAETSVSRECAFPTDPVTILDDQGLVLRSWSFPLGEVHLGGALPEDPDFLAYRSTIRGEGAESRYPVLDLPSARDEAEAEIWRDEAFNNDLAYRGQAGSIEPITCLDALLFAEQNRRVPQLERPTEFLASVLRRDSGEGVEVIVVFGAGDQLFPPRSVDGLEVVAGYLAEGWRYWYFLHNHTRQGNGALGVPVPSTSDVRFARNLASELGLERVRVTNGFYTFDAGIEELGGFRAR